MNLQYKVFLIPIAAMEHRKAVKGQLVLITITTDLDVEPCAA